MASVGGSVDSVISSDTISSVSLSENGILWKEEIREQIFCQS